MQEEEDMTRTSAAAKKKKMTTTTSSSVIPPLNSDETSKESLTLPEQSISNCYQGERLDDLLSRLATSIESAKASRGPLPEKIWIKQQFAVGVNDVTRVLERMPQRDGRDVSNKETSTTGRRRAPLVPLQAVILAADCTPRWLTKHIPSLACSREVAVISVKDNKGGSLRLGELVNVKTALAIGIKAKGSIINETILKVLGGSGSTGNADEIVTQDASI